MKNRKKIFISFFLIILTVTTFMLTYLYQRLSQSQIEKEDNIEIVTSFYPMYIAAMNLLDGVDGVSLDNLSEPQTGCLHDYQLTPEDMKLLSTADVFIYNGGGIESFIADIAKAYPHLVMINAGEDVPMLEDNSHFWMSVPRYQMQVANIQKGLTSVISDVDGQKKINQNAKVYSEQLDDLIFQQQSIKQQVQGRQIIIFHEAYAYVADDYGLKVAYLMDLDEERQISAGEVADVIFAIQTNHIATIFAEQQYGQKMGETVMSQTDAKVYYLNTLVRSNGSYDANDYLKQMQDNITMIKRALEVE